MFHRYGGGAAALFVVTLAAGPLGAQQQAGDVGESCRARVDCRQGLRCVQNICREPVVACRQDADCGIGMVCQAGRCQEVALGATRKGGGWSDFTLGGTHFFGGVTFAPGMTGFWDYGGPVEVHAGFMFALRLGMLFDRTELALELAPKTWIWDFDQDLSSLSFNVSIGGLVSVARQTYWPLRFGLGLTHGDLPLEEVYMQGRLDLIGLAFNYGHLLFEISLPSTRFHTEFKHVGIWAWLFNLSIYYII